MRICRFVIECATPLHCGGGTDEIQDQPVARDAFGYWRIPGTSLAGALRALAASMDARLARRLFGEQEADRSHPSQIWCEDGLLLDYDGKTAMEKVLTGAQPLISPGPFVRDHVRIDLESGAGEEGGKFDAEIVPAGTRFLLELRCDGWDKELDSDELAFFDKLCGQILAGLLPLGGKSGLGYGLYRVLDYACREIRLTDPEGMAAWIALPEFGLPRTGMGQPVQLGPATKAAVPGLDGWLELPLACAGPLLIGGGATQRSDGTESEADLIFALTPRINYEGTPHEVWEPVLPASALRGVLRHAVYAILKDLGAADCEAILNGLFGFVSNEAASCGKLVITDTRLEFEDNRPHYQFEQHVALDRFSCAPMEGALFSEEPLWNDSANARLRIRACGLEAHEAALFFHALLDLFEGSLAFGSGANRGNGRLGLPGWRDNPAKAATVISGSLAWHGECVFANGLAGLEKLAPQWDSALKAIL